MAKLRHKLKSSNFLFPFFSCCSITLSQNPPVSLPAPHHPTSCSHRQSLPSCRLPCSLTRPFSFFPCYPLPSSPPVTVSWVLISMSLVLFVHLFLLFISFHLQVRSCGICLWPLGFCHLVQNSPVPSMLSQRVGAPSFILLHSIPLRKGTTAF